MNNVEFRIPEEDLSLHPITQLTEKDVTTRTPKGW